jgi:hypothetical protein
LLYLVVGGFRTFWCRVVLSDDKRDQLVRWLRESTRLAVRARIVLRCAEPDVAYEQLAADLGVSR